MLKIIRFVRRILFTLITLFTLLLIYANFAKIEIPNNKINIFDTNNKIIYTSHSSNILNIDNYPSFIKDAIVTVEDKRFYSHIGFDPARILKSLYTNFKQQAIIEGGSTITQQYAKNIFLNNKQTLSRKFNELLYALRLEMRYTKEEILNGYMNSIYYGHGVYGFQNASMFYFGKQPAALSIAEIALLIGIPNGPSYYSPIQNLTNAYKKRNSILEILYINNLITEEEYNTSLKETIQLDNKNYLKENEKNYYIDAVLAQISEMKYDGDINVYTYFDENAQNALSASVSKHCKDITFQTSGIIMEPYSGNIIALVGGNDYTASSYNRALYAKRQIASTIKPLLYYCALSQGFTPSSAFSSEPTSFTLEDGSVYTPENYNKYYPNKDISMIHAMRTSDNIYAVKTHLFLGSEILKDALSAFGFSCEAHPSLALGTIHLSIYELSQIYNTFASEGYYVEPSFIRLITQNEDILYKHNPNPKQLLDRDTTLVLNQLMTSTYDMNYVEDVYPTLYGNSTEVKTAVKSGTSNWDTWAIGFNPYYTVGIWNGYDDNKNIKEEEYEISKRIWKDCFNTLMIDKNNIWYKPSNKIIEKKVNPITGKEDDTGSVYWYLE